jgi:hypothetical protein
MIQICEQTLRAFSELFASSLCLPAMNYPISANAKGVASRTVKVNIDAAMIGRALAAAVESARTQGQSLDDLKAEVMADDALLDAADRRWLRDIVAKAWDRI